jgi:3-oxoacyl-[acyl-carrier protein] reductase
MKTSLIVGGTRGIGSVITERLKDRGDQIFTASRRDNNADNHFSFDISSVDDVKNVVSSFSSKSEKINYLVFSQRYRGEDPTQEFQITVDGVAKLINAFQDSWSAESSIVIMGSNASRFILDEQPVNYHASRAALEGMVRYYAVTLGRYGVRCNCIMPTTIIKPENEHFFTEDNDVRHMIEEITPLRRMGKADDVANLVEFLCSEKSSFITGQSFFVDGGVSLVGQESLARKLTNLEHSI